MLEWHQLKQVAGLVIAGVPCRLPEIAPWLAAQPVGELARVLTDLDLPADEADRLKRRGFYVVRAARSVQLSGSSERTGP
jgi:hypothetical protein